MNDEGRMVGYSAEWVAMEEAEEIRHDLLRVERRLEVLDDRLIELGRWLVVSLGVLSLSVLALVASAW